MVTHVLEALPGPEFHCEECGHHVVIDPSRDGADVVRVTKLGDPTVRHVASTHRELRLGGGSE